MARFQQYRHSGQPGLGLPLGLVVGALVAVAGAWLYQRFVIWVPFIYITLLGTAAYGAGIGFVIGLVMRAGKTRNLIMAGAVGALCGVLGDAASFHFDYDYRLAEAAEEINASGEAEGTITAEDLREAISFSDYIDLRTENGFSVGRGGSGGLPLKGVLVYLIWLIELGVIAAVAFWMARGRVMDTFCERCAQWMMSRPVGARVGVDVGRLHMAVRDGDAAPLLAPALDPESAITATYEVHECARCRENPYLTVTLSWQEINSKGKEETKTEVAAYQIGVTPADIEALSQELHGGQPVQTMEA